MNTNHLEVFPSLEPVFLVVCFLEAPDSLSLRISICFRDCCKCSELRCGLAYGYGGCSQRSGSGEVHSLNLGALLAYDAHSLSSVAPQVHEDRSLSSVAQQVHDTRSVFNCHFQCSRSDVLAEVYVQTCMSTHLGMHSSRLLRLALDWI